MRGRLGVVGRTEQKKKQPRKNGTSQGLSDQREKDEKQSIVPGNAIVKVNLGLRRKLVPWTVRGGGGAEQREDGLGLSNGRALDPPSWEEETGCRSRQWGVGIPSRRPNREGGVDQNKVR